MTTPPNLRIAECCLSCADYRPKNLNIPTGYCLIHRCDRNDTDICDDYTDYRKPLGKKG